MDIMLNRWLLYQTLACRVWARAAFYQASGAYGFRDQLQDVMALCVVQPGIARAQLLRAAARQFLEGDVQHWWLPASNSGIRTRISDDRVWLGFVVSHYIEATGDVAVLQEMVPFLEGPVLQEHQDEAFFAPTVSDHQATLYEHCALALDNSLALGAHRLPLMGTGDWNDGMNRVGEKGRGESVWLGWLLHATLTRFSAYAEPARATVWRQHCAQLQLALDSEGWDGAWYRRAYFDDGTPLGSHLNDECRIDGIAQSWSVISGAGAPAHAAQAMAAVRDQLVRQDDQLVLLFTPPFDRTTHEPGYIKGYPPGIRENGGQYTHGAIWSVIAMAMLGDGDAAQGLFSLINPINHAATPRTRRALPGGALCGRRRHLRRGPACRPRRLDLVHGIGGLAASRRPGMDPGLSRAGRAPGDGALHSQGLARLRDRLPPPQRALRDRGHQSEWRQRRHCRRHDRRHRHRRPGRRGRARR